jgi:hypothetical protein
VAAMKMRFIVKDAPYGTERVHKALSKVHELIKAGAATLSF